MLSSLWHGLIASGNVIIRNEHNSRIQCYVWHKVHNILWAPWRHISISLLPPSASGDQGIGLVWDSHPNWTKLSMMGPQLFSGWYQMILDVFQCSQLFSNVLRLFSDNVFRLFSDDVFRLLKSSSNWTKLSMMGPKLISGWYQMILDVFRCSQLFCRFFQPGWNFYG